MTGTDSITSIIILRGQPVVPTVPATYTVVNVNLNSNAGGAYLYLAYSRSSIHGDPITGLQVFAEYQSNTFPGQPGFTRVNNDLSEGAGGKYVFAFYKKKIRQIVQFIMWMFWLVLAAELTLLMTLGCELTKILMKVLVEVMSISATRKLHEMDHMICSGMI